MLPLPESDMSSAVAGLLVIFRFTRLSVWTILEDNLIYADSSSTRHMKILLLLLLVILLASLPLKLRFRPLRLKNDDAPDRAGDYE